MSFYLGMTFIAKKSYHIQTVGPLINSKGYIPDNERGIYSSAEPKDLTNSDKSLTNK